jgi:hypothetical protein
MKRILLLLLINFILITQAAECSSSVMNNCQHYRTVGFISWDYFYKPNETNHSLSHLSVSDSSFSASTTYNISGQAYSLDSLSNLLWNIIRSRIPSPKNGETAASSSFLIATKETIESNSSQQAEENSPTIEGEVVVEVGMFPNTQEEKCEAQHPHVWECVGCLCDTVVLTIHLSDKNIYVPQEGGDKVECLENYLRHLYHGIHRRRQLSFNYSSIGTTGIEGNTIPLILNVVVCLDADEKQPKLDQEKTISSLQRIILEQYNKERYSSLFQLDLVTMVTNLTQHRNISNSIDTSDSEKNHRYLAPSWFTSCCFITDQIKSVQRRHQQQLVPFGLFSTLAKQVYSSLQNREQTTSVTADFPLSDPREQKNNKKSTNTLSFVRIKLPRGMITNSNGNTSTTYQQEVFKPSSIKQTPNISTNKDTYSNAIRTGDSKQFNAVHLFQEILERTNSMLNRLEQKQITLSTNSMPVLEFGRDMDDILQHAMDVLSSEGLYAQSIILSTMNQFILSERIQQLFSQQMSLLREYYGTQYQQIVEDIIPNLASDQSNNYMHQHELMAKESRRILDRFCIAAKHSIPKTCQLGGTLYSDNSTTSTTNTAPGGNRFYLTYLDTMTGLIEDMQHITLQFLEDEDSSNDETDIEEEEIFPAGERNKIKKWYNKVSFSLKQLSRRKKWYNKVANKVIAIGINYIQSVLALQALRRAAAERDRNMPKFPLF